MECTVTHAGSNVHFTVTGKIDEQGAEELKARFLSLDRSAITDAIFDFSDVPHIGSAGIGKLLLFYKELAVSGGVIRIENVSPALYDLFAVLRLDSIFSISKG
ncbi:anti-sigma-factor antagonist [Desulfonema ishimotonii]|uniref:Anti-sigma-factor antagonist n=1 Tax=Desulfonema ishimotonii TaxID=45657 RepID=A0A401FRI2_9BACT|nr:STAS domain-containing protein [Desulfonema ishimotonii]GBC59574.1 anti-sigma-factor antagonist [Desulfonema ishimotonii]